MNVFSCVGRLGKDPEHKVNKDGVAVCSFSIAVKVSKEKDIWVKCTAWRDRADFAHDYLRKGQQIAVHGPIDTEEWTGQDGEKHFNLKLTVNNITLLGKKEDNAQPAERKQTVAASSSSDGDCPF